jgi:SnoaL-like domain
MSEKLAVVRRWVELYNERTDVTEFLSSLDPEVELQTPGGPRLRGHDQIRGWFEKELENAQSRIIPDRFVEEDDVIAGLRRTEVRWIESSEIARSSAQTSRLNSAISRIGEVATTEAVRKPPTATSGGAKRMPDMPLAGQRLPGSDFDLGRHAGDGGKLVFGRVGEERESPQPGSVHLFDLTPLWSYLRDVARRPLAGAAVTFLRWVRR